MGATSLYSIFSNLTPPREAARIREEPAKYQVQVIQQKPATADQGLNLQLVGDLLRKAQSGEELERLLNSKDNGVNNLDLNGNGEVEYIRVKEFQDGAVRGFHLSAEPEPGQVQQIATIRIEKSEDDPSGQTAKTETRGAPELYGQDSFFRSSWSGVGAGLMLGYLFGRSHSPWSSPWSYGHYPPGYASQPAVSPQTYQDRHKARLAESSYGKHSQRDRGQAGASSSSERGSSGPATKKSIAESRQSQKSFTARPGHKRLERGGFDGKREPRRSFGQGRQPVRSGGFGRRR